MLLIARHHIPTHLLTQWHHILIVFPTFWNENEKLHFLTLGWEQEWQIIPESFRNRLQEWGVVLSGNYWERECHQKIWDFVLKSKVAKRGRYGRICPALTDIFFSGSAKFWTLLSHQWVKLLLTCQKRCNIYCNLFTIYCSSKREIKCKLFEETFRFVASYEKLKKRSRCSLSTKYAAQKESITIIFCDAKNTNYF